MSLELNKEFKLEMKRQKRQLSSEQSLQNLTKEKLTFTYSYQIKSIELKMNIYFEYFMIVARDLKG